MLFRSQGHSDYLKANNTVSHDQIVGKTGFTGATLADRFVKAGYSLNRSNSYAYGEVIAGASNNSGFYLAEELITAIYHRFAIFEPIFKEAGACTRARPSACWAVPSRPGRGMPGRS